MSSESGFSSWLIGNGGLLIECAKILQSYGNRVDYIISKDSFVISWAIDHGIPAAESIQALLASAGAPRPDYFFSISSDVILSGRELRIPRKIAINYHNGPLPRYGGVHVSSWAIINQENTYGITWHVMDALVDGGDIVQQVVFPVMDETTLSLNIKCYDHALIGFNNLVEQLNMNIINRIPQNINERTYFSLDRRIVNAGLINWNMDGYKIDAICRSTEFGPYHNGFGVAKFIFGKRAFILRKINVIADDYKIKPGIILDISDDKIYISTKTVKLCVQEILSVYGDQISVSDFVEQNNIETGKQIDIVSEALIKKIQDIWRYSRKYEKFWVELLDKLYNSEMKLFSDHTLDIVRDDRKRVMEFEFSEELEKRLRGNDKSVDVIFAALATRIARDNSGLVKTLLRNKWTTNYAEGVTQLFEDRIPLILNIGSDWNINFTIDIINHCINDLQQKGTYLRDVHYRYFSPGKINFKPILILLDVNYNDADLEKCSLMIDIKLNCISIITNERDDIYDYAKKLFLDTEEILQGNFPSY